MATRQRFGVLYCKFKFAVQDATKNPKLLPRLFCALQATGECLNSSALDPERKMPKMAHSSTRHSLM